MISVVLYGRNDNYGYNLHKRAALSLNCIAEVLNEADEILFVDYNTPDDFPTFPEAIQDTLTERARELLRIFRVRPFIHDRFKSKTRLLALEPIARNVAVRRSRSSSRWILSTNTDMIFILQRASALTDLVRGLPLGFYHAPRIEIPEALWESLDRRNPSETIQNVRDWGWSLHLNEIVFGSESILYDGPGDFQLLEREDLIKYHGFNEEMLLGWHVDSNIAKRMGLVYGKVGDLGNEVYGYHCDHTRQITAAHSHMRTENNWRRFVEEVETPALPEQAGTWGCADDEIEEIHLRTNPAQIYVKALKETIGGPLTKPRFAQYTSSTYDKVDYDPPHIMPFLADLFVSSARDSNVAWYAAQTETLNLFARVWQKLGFTGKILVDESVIEKSLCHRSNVHFAPRDAILAEADAFVFDFATMFQQTSANVRVIFADVDNLLAVLMHVIKCERERTNAGKQSRRIISLNAINNRFEGFVCRRIAAAYSPFSGRMRHGFVLPAPPLTPGTALDCRGNGISMVYQDEGWSHPEDPGTWTNGPRASLTAKLIGWPADDMILEVKARPFLVKDRHPSLAVDVMANGTMVGRWTYCYPQDNSPVVRSVRIPASLLATSFLNVEFQIDEPAVPTVMGVHPTDDRQLGLFVSSISFLSEQDKLQRVGAVVAAGAFIDFRANCQGAAYQVDGWALPENAGTWTNGSRATLSAKLVEWPAQDMILQINARPFLVQDRRPSLAVEVIANGVAVNRWTYRDPEDNGWVVRSARIPAALLAACPILNIELQIDQSAAPVATGIHPTDNRQLGLFVSGVSFLTEQDAAAAPPGSSGDLCPNGRPATGMRSWFSSTMKVVRRRVAFIRRISRRGHT